MQDTALLQKIDAFIVENKDALVRDIKKLVDIPSVQGEPEEGAPFGVQVKHALDTALDLAADLGLTAHQVDGYFGYADLPGTGAQQIGIITHLDVVPAGNGWTQDPFDMIEKEGYLLGRGVADDKGPAVLSLYTAKFFAECGKQMPHTLRILLGTNEETGMAGLKYYLERFAPPAFCFTPDAEFPVCYGEKGNYNGRFVSGPLVGNLVSFEGGVATNVVPDRAVAVVRTGKSAAELPSAERVTVSDAGDGCVRIEGAGKGGHASLPQGTINAILLVVDYLLDHKLCTESEEQWLHFMHRLLCATDGSTMGIASQDDIFTPLTCVGGVVKLENGVITQTVDVRYPTTMTGARLTETFSAAAQEAGGAYKMPRDAVPFVTSANTPEVRALIESYNEVTGKQEKPFTIGGGTYARHFPRAVSFGPEEMGVETPAWVGTMHGANEGMSVEALLRALKIYILGVARLMELPLG